MYKLSSITEKFAEQKMYLFISITQFYIQINNKLVIHF